VAVATKNTETTEVVEAKKERAPRVPRLERLKAEILKAEQLEQEKLQKKIALAKSKWETALVALAKAEDKAKEAEAEYVAAKDEPPLVTDGVGEDQGEGS